MTKMDEEKEPNASRPTEMTREEKELLEAKEKKIKTHISQLEELIEDMTHKLETVKFGDLKIDPGAIAAVTPSTSAEPDIDDRLQLELFKLSGFWCSKCTDTVLVYKFSPTSNYQKPHAVQLLLNGDKIKVGKWALPWGISIEHILRETPLDRMSQTATFLKNCKRHINCYERRTSQIASLRKLTEEVKNIRVEGSLGNLTMHIKLMWVNNSILKLKHHMMICLFYESGEVRPHLIKTSWSLEKKPDENMIIEMSKFVKDFKKYELEEAYEVIANKNHPIFNWKPDYGESTQEIDLGYEYSSDEESIEESQPKRKQKQMKKRVVKRKKALEKNEESQEKDSLASSEDDKESLVKDSSKNKSTKVMSAKPKTKPSAKKVSEKLVASVAKKPAKSPASKNNRVDKGQTRLSFKGVPLDISVEKTPRTRAFNQRMRETSTPKTTLGRKLPVVSLVPISISPIESDSSEINNPEKSQEKKNKGKKK